MSTTTIQESDCHATAVESLIPVVTYEAQVIRVVEIMRRIWLVTAMFRLMIFAIINTISEPIMKTGGVSRSDHQN